MTKHYAYLFTGDREWDGREDLRVLHDVLEQIPKGSVLIHGNARGLDRMAATHWPLVVAGPAVSVPYFGYLRRRGGPARNAFMLSLLQRFATDHDVCCVGFHRNLGESHGTLDMMTRAYDRGVPVVLWPSDGVPWAPPSVPAPILPLSVP